MEKRKGRNARSPELNQLGFPIHVAIFLGSGRMEYGPLRAEEKQSYLFSAGEVPVFQYLLDIAPSLVGWFLRCRSSSPYYGVGSGSGGPRTIALLAL
jgi:hypothetical protein